MGEPEPVLIMVLLTADYVLINYRLIIMACYLFLVFSTDSGVF